MKCEIVLKVAGDAGAEDAFRALQQTHYHPQKPESTSPSRPPPKISFALPASKSKTSRKFALYRKVL
jgi:hypothetical protein